MDNRDRTLRFYDRIFYVSLLTLPYLDYLSLGGALTTVIYLLKTFQKTALDSFTRNGLLLISGLMILSAVVGVHPGESLLQLANFLPFFLLFAVLPFLLNTVEKLERIAIGLVLAAIPIHLVSLVEYIVKSPFLPAPIQAIGLIARWRNTPHVGRSMVRFDHPNVLASYGIVILGLGLGLILKESLSDQCPSMPRRRVFLIYAGTWASLIGIFCSGSRNGLLIAIVQLGLFSLLVRPRWIGVIVGGVSGGAIALSSLFLGIGGRVLFASSLTDDPRVGVWKIALDLMRERPLLGWGLGNYKWLYPDRMIDPNFPYIAHPHNLWLLLGCETGIPVMLGLTAVVGYVCYQAVQRLVLRQLKLSESAILLSYLLAFGGCTAFALFDITFYDARINVINWVALAGVYSIAVIGDAAKLVPAGSPLPTSSPWE